MKTGANILAHPTLLQMITNLPLMIGYSLYGISTLLSDTCAAEGELSVLYPIISLTYVWVTLLSITVFKESVNGFQSSWTCDHRDRRSGSGEWIRASDDSAFFHIAGPFVVVRRFVRSCISEVRLIAG